MVQKPIRKTLILVGALTLICVAAVAPPAHASAIQVIRDCSDDGVLDKKYSQRELAGALHNLPSDLDEYTDCRGVIRRAQLAGARGKRKPGRGIVDKVDTARPASAHERKKIREASSRARPVKIGTRTVRPGESGALAASALGTKLPPLVLASLIGLALCALATGALALERRRPGAWQAVGGTVYAPARRIGEGVKRGIARFRR
jgi:hypothetical protein